MDVESVLWVVAGVCGGWLLGRVLFWIGISVYRWRREKKRQRQVLVEEWGDGDCGCSVGEPIGHIYVPEDGKD